MAVKPETHYFPPTSYAPNNEFPVIVYRGILPQPVTEETVTEYLTRNKWHKLVISKTPEFAPYQPDISGHRARGVISPNPVSIPILMNAMGTSTLRIGAAAWDHPKDGDENLHLISVRPGDVIILPAGTCHSCVESQDAYRYIGVYPENCPKYRSCYGGHEDKLDELKEEVTSVPMPECDPAFGVNGPLKQLWTMK